MRKKLTVPPFLAEGDKVALISPSFHTPMENVEGAADVLRSWGFEPVIGRNADKEYRGSYAGTALERAQDLVDALEDPEVKAIICNRGGYGAIGLIDLVPDAALKENPKWLVGFSDITTLIGMEMHAGVMSIHGTMGKFLKESGGTDLSSTLLRDILTGTIPDYVIPSHKYNCEGTASGTLVGGNLATFTPLLGTSADVTACNDIILFIEEVEENMTHIDRLFNTLRFNGVLDRCKGVILGEFTDCDANLGYESVEELLYSYIKDCNIPLCCGFPAGHGDVNLPLIMGAKVTLEVNAKQSHLSFHVNGI